MVTQCLLVVPWESMDLTLREWLKFSCPSRWSAVVGPALLECVPLGVASWDHGPEIPRSLEL